MTLFEYLAIAYSLVLSFAAMRLLEGLPQAAAAQRRYWPHLLLVVYALLNCVTTFWVYWSFKGASWDYVSFLLMLTNPGLNYFMACTLIPRNPDAVVSWQQYFTSVRRRYFVAFGCWAIAIAVASSVLLSMPLSHPSRIAHVTYFGVAAIGVATPSERVMSIVAPFLLVFWCVSALALRQPGSLISP